MSELADEIRSLENSAASLRRDADKLDKSADNQKIQAASLRRRAEQVEQQLSHLRKEL